MHLNEIIDDIASQADDFLADASNRDQARAGIAELLNADHSHLSPSDRRRVIDGVMKILEDEDFFDSRYASKADDGGDLGSDDDSDE
ncbi:hypothetical protein Ga0100231_020185 [Opitutaceae bacterium TAV4]|uniref:hypothetical protein n=1 Tax=Geminisphaera colitermitum TaxID=1148786 RepID=UPI000F6377C0|nr:hypothetical protein [Geminisphaera colitermitum]RRJ96229.1 hypothetical protein Ga0100231_020185 [Opitutaceae bacterium TAV4]